MLNASMLWRTTYRLRWPAIVWLVTFLGLWSAWSEQPRLTLDRSDTGIILGITSDSRSMVALTRRAIPITSNGSLSHQQIVSGPIQIWDLQTGDCRLVELPGQLLSTEIDRALDDALVDPDAWQISYPPEPLDGRHCRLIQSKGTGERWSVELELVTGTINRTRLPDAPPANDSTIKMSRHGRWIADLRHAGEPTFIRIIDANSGRVVLEFNGSWSHEIYFSDDEQLVAVIQDRYDLDEPTTSIWQLDPLKKLQEFDRGIANITFAPSNQRFACVDNSKIALIDIASGKTLTEFATIASANSWSQFSGSGYRFLPDERRLVGYDYFRGGSSGIAGPHCYISEVYLWDVDTGQIVIHHPPVTFFYFDPHLCDDALNSRTTPQKLIDNHHLIDVESGATIFQIPSNATIEQLSPDNCFAVLQRRTERDTSWAHLVAWKVRLPGFRLQRNQDDPLQICDIRSGRIVKTLPPPEYIVGYGALLISPDSQTLVTMTREGMATNHVQVWELTSTRRSFQPLAWSMLAPALCLAWQRLRRSRARK